MLSQPYFYLYLVSSIFVFVLGDAMKNSQPANPNLIPIAGLVGLITNVANYAFLILCLFFAEHWWYPIIMWAISFVTAILIPPTRGGFAFLGIIVAPLCTICAYVSLF